jgi:aromatic-L-amino-acid/L-tryptophan decarboxylase
MMTVGLDVPVSTSVNAANATAEFVRHEIDRFQSSIRNLSVAPHIDAESIRSRLHGYDFETPRSLEHAIRDVASMLRDWTLHNTHPRYFGLFNPGVHEAGIWADALAALYNPQLGAWWHAPAATAIEQHTLLYLGRVLGIVANAAHFTTGGSEANLTAVLGAITRAYPSAPELGISRLAGDALVYVSSQAHHSFQKALRVAGLGDAALRTVPCDRGHRIDIAALSRQIAADRLEGKRPILLVGTVGTTTAGACDDLVRIGALAAEHGAWFHVDAAWGGFACLTPELGHLLAGIENADSATWDAHKSLSVPMGAGMFFCRHGEVLRRIFEIDASYVPEESRQGADLYLTSLQWSRRFIGLKVFLTLVTQGTEGIRARIHRQCRVADFLRGELQSAGWTIVNQTALPLVCFSHERITSHRLSAKTIARAVVSGGKAWLSASSLPEGEVLRACVTHDDCSEADVRVLVTELEKALSVSR